MLNYCDNVSFANADAIDRIDALNDARNDILGCALSLRCAAVDIASIEPEQLLLFHNVLTLAADAIGSVAYALEVEQEEKAKRGD